MRTRRARLAPFIPTTAFILTTALPALATEIRDGTAFSVVVPAEARTCLFVPESARDTEACAGIRVPEHAPLDPGGGHLLAAGAVRLADSAIAALAVVRYVAVPSDEDQAASEALASFIANEILHKMQRRFPDASLRIGSQRVTVETTRGLRLAKIAFELDTGSAPPLIQHAVWYVTWADEGTYWVGFMANAAQAAAVEALADATASSIRAANPIGTNAERAVRAARAILLVAAVAGILAAAARWLRARRRAARVQSRHGAP